MNILDKKSAGAFFCPLDKKERLLTRRHFQNLHCQNFHCKEKKPNACADKTAQPISLVHPAVFLEPETPLWQGFGAGHALGALALALFYGALDRKKSPIEAPLRSLVTVLVSKINHCAFCVDINSATLLKRGVSPEMVLALDEWQDNPIFDQRQLAALDYADAITRTGREVSEQMIKRLKTHFDDDALVELTAVIAFQNLSSKFNSALDVPAQGFCSILEPAGTSSLQDEDKKHPEAK